MRRPGFLHTSPVHVETFDRLLVKAGARTSVLHRVDEELLSEARRLGAERLADRVRARLDELVADGAEVICCTCSTLGAVAERAGVAVPVFRVDRPMAARAVGIGTMVSVVAALESTVEPTRELLLDEARRQGTAVEVRVAVADGAWRHFESGDHEGYVREVARVARRVAASSDVVVLAQASMADAAAQLGDLGLPVLASPPLAVEHLLSGGRR